MFQDELQCILESDSYVRPLLGGVYAPDTMPQYVNYPSCYVSNTAPSWTSGQHWVAFYFDSYGNGEFYDSLGNPPEHYQPSFKHFMDINCRNQVFQRKQIQSSWSSVCGSHCIYYLTWRCRGSSLPDIVNRFSRDTAYNDYIVAEFVNTHYRFVCNFKHLGVPTSRGQRAVALLDYK